MCKRILNLTEYNLLGVCTAYLLSDFRKEIERLKNQLQSKGEMFREGEMVPKILVEEMHQAVLAKEETIQVRHRKYAFLKFSVMFFPQCFS